MSIDPSGDRAEQPGETPAASPGGEVVDPQSVEGVFVRALQRAPAEREKFVAQACGGDDQRQKQVTALLRAYEDAGSFLETPPIAPAPPEEDVALDFLQPSESEGALGTLGTYEVRGVIGRGGMGVVLEAFDPKLSRVVAIKVLLPELAASGNARRRFLREARAAAAISHPNVVTIHAVEEADGGEAERLSAVPPYLVMERVVGQSLQQKLQRHGPLAAAELLRIGRQIADGLAAAHQQGLVHRDIKPANILLENGVERVKITDFGLARAIDDVTVTRTGELSGTPQYMSPEQAAGQRIDHRSDLFGLGCVMYAMCTGHSPFRAIGLAQAVQRVTQETPRPIHEQNPEMPPWLSEIIASLLEKDPALRFQSARELTAGLDQHLARLQQGTSPDARAWAANRSSWDARRPRPQTPSELDTESEGEAEPAPTGTQGMARGLFWMGVALVMAGLASLWVLVTSPRILEPFPLIERNSQYYCLTLIGSGILLLIAGTIFRADNRGLPAWLLMLYVLLGPLGLVLWMIHRDLRQRSGEATRKMEPAARAGVSGAGEAHPAAKAAGESSHGEVGRYLILCGIYLLAQPWLLIAMGPVMADGDIMELGGSFVEAGFLWGTLAIALGYVLRYIVDTAQDRHRQLRPSLPIVLAATIAVLVAVGISVMGGAV